MKIPTTAREFQSTFVELEGKLKSDEWTKRQEGLRELRELLVSDISRYEGHNRLFIRFIRPALLDQLADLRSSIIGIACLCVNALIQHTNSILADGAAEWLLPPLLSCSCITNATISKAAVQSIHIIAQTGKFNTFSYPQVIRACQSKHPTSRCHAYDCLVCTFLTTDPALVVRYSVEITDALHNGFSDASQEVRFTSRLGFWALESIAPEVADALMNAEPHTVVSGVREDEARYKEWVEKSALSGGMSAPSSRAGEVARAKSRSRSLGGYHGGEQEMGDSGRNQQKVLRQGRSVEKPISRKTPLPRGTECAGWRNEQHTRTPIHSRETPIRANQRHEKPKRSVSVTQWEARENVLTRGGENFLQGGANSNNSPARHSFTQSGLFRSPAKTTPGASQIDIALVKCSSSDVNVRNDGLRTIAITLHTQDNGTIAAFTSCLPKLESSVQIGNPTTLHLVMELLLTACNFPEAFQSVIEKHLALHVLPPALLCSANTDEAVSNKAKEVLGSLVDMFDAEIFFAALERLWEQKNPALLCASLDMASLLVSIERTTHLSDTRKLDALLSKLLGLLGRRPMLDVQRASISFVNELLKHYRNNLHQAIQQLRKQPRHAAALNLLMRGIPSLRGGGTTRLQLPHAPAHRTPTTVHSHSNQPRHPTSGSSNRQPNTNSGIRQTPPSSLQTDPNIVDFLELEKAALKQATPTINIALQSPTSGTPFDSFNDSMRQLRSSVSGNEEALLAQLKDTSLKQSILGHVLRQVMRSVKHTPQNWNPRTNGRELVCHVTGYCTSQHPTNIRRLSIHLLKLISQQQNFYSLIHSNKLQLLYEFLKARGSSDAELSATAKKALESLLSGMPMDDSLQTLCDVLTEMIHSNDQELAESLRLVGDLLLRSKGNYSVVTVLPRVMELHRNTLLHANATVRKNSVLNCVDGYMAFSEHIVPHFANLSQAQLKLITIYVNQRLNTRGGNLHSRIDLEQELMQTRKLS